MEWQEENFFEETLYMNLPRALLDMPKEMRKERYPYIKQPQIIKIDHDKDMIFSISLLNIAMGDQGIMGIITHMMWEMTHVYPQCILTKARSITKENLELGWFSYQTDSIVEEKHFHIMFVFALEKQVVLGAVNSPMQKRKDTEAVFEEIVNTIKADKKKQGNKR